MQESSKHALRTLAFVVGCICLLIGAGLLAMAFANHNPYSESDARPFTTPVKLDNTEARIEFTAPTNENYVLRLSINVPAEAKDSTEKWVQYNCLVGTVLDYHSCEAMAHLNVAWTIRDMTDGDWRNWERTAKPRFEVTDGVGWGEIGWFKPVADHHYIITANADADAPAIRQSPASLYASFGSEDNQYRMAFGNFFAYMWMMFAAPFLFIGLPLVLIFFPRQTHL